MAPGLGTSPGGEHGNPLQYSCLENPHGQRSLEGCHPWGREDSEMTKQLSTAQPQVTEAAPPLGLPSDFGCMILDPTPDLSGCSGICIPNGPLDTVEKILAWETGHPGSRSHPVSCDHHA